MDESRRQVLMVAAGLFGLMAGSFLNVCIFRLPRNCMSILRQTRSMCPKCRSLIAWYDNIPVVSWIVLGGRCRHCEERISPRYMVVEVFAAALITWAAFIQLYHPTLDDGVQRVTLFAIQVYLIAAIIVSTFIDIDWEILPDEINYSGLAFGLIAGAAFPEVLFGEIPREGWVTWLPQDLRPHGYGLVQSALGAALGYGILRVVDLLGRVMFQKRLRRLRMENAMGGGDWKYLAFLGAFLGWEGIGLTFLVSILAGALFGIGRFVVRREFGKVPFGPFLSLGALATLFARPQLKMGLEAYLRFVRGLIG